MFIQPKGSNKLREFRNRKVEGIVKKCTAYFMRIAVRNVETCLNELLIKTKHILKYNINIRKIIGKKFDWWLSFLEYGHFAVVSKQKFEFFDVKMLE